MLSSRQVTLLRKWLGVSRTRIFTAVITPCLVGVAVAYTDGFFSPVRLVLLVSGLIFAEMMNLFLADWVDYKKIDVSRGRAILPPPLEGNPMLSPAVLPLKYTFHAAIAVMVPALAILVFFAFDLGWPIVVILIIAGITGAFYVAPPFNYAFFSTAVLPPVVAFGAYFVLSGVADWKAGLSALPILFISSGVIYTYRVLYEPGIPGQFRKKRQYLRMLYTLCYLTLLVLVISGLTTWWMLLGLLSLPLYFLIDRLTIAEKIDYMPATSLGVLVHFTTGILIAAGYVISHHV